MKLYRAKRVFELGRTGIQLKVGQVVGFDGRTVRVNGLDYELPQLRAAIASGWLEVVP